MTLVEKVDRLDTQRIETLVFAGGGNRCWWQAGAMSALMDQGWSLPRQLIGTSAGAAIAAACITKQTKAALDACLSLYSSNNRNLNLRELLRCRLRFSHHHIYPNWLMAFINSETFGTIQRSQVCLRVGLARPARLLGLFGSVAAGTLIYMADKYLRNKLHSRIPTMIGLRTEFIEINSCETVNEAQLLLRATAAAPPIMASQRILGRPAIDGGYVDNAPIPSQSPTEKSGTLVLLTRHYPTLPQIFKYAGRNYWQPTRRIPVSTWDCTHRSYENVRDAVQLGILDATHMLTLGRIRA